jgi:hypothetical protein
MGTYERSPMDGARGIAVRPYPWGYVQFVPTILVKFETPLGGRNVISEVISSRCSIGG